MAKRKVVIMGAAGRDFHNFNCLFRDNPEAEVVAFTATQIPDIEGRVYPPSLAGKLYPKGIPIFPESDLERLVKENEVDDVWFSYSDVPHQYVMDKGSHVIAWGANFGVCSVQRTMIKSTQAGHRGLRRAHRCRQVADHPLRVAHPQGHGEEGRRDPSPDAVRRPREAGVPAVRDVRRPGQARVHDRGARGVRAAHRQRLHRLRRRGLRDDPARGGEGSRRDPLGRRQQRHAVLQTRPPDHARGPAPSRPRADVLPGRVQLPAWPTC